MSFPVLTALDDIACDPIFQPYWGWHDDHRQHDRTPQYMPAVQQNRAEFHTFMDLFINQNMNGKCVQLGIGPTGASHALFLHVFYRVWSVDRNPMPPGIAGLGPWVVMGDTHNPHVFDHLKAWGATDIDCLFIDAGHKYEDVEADFYMYKPLVRPGGIIAFHDAIKRPTYETEIEVWDFLDKLKQLYTINIIGDEIGIAWMVA